MWGIRRSGHVGWRVRSTGAFAPRMPRATDLSPFFPIRCKAPSRAADAPAGLPLDDFGATPYGRPTGGRRGALRFRARPRAERGGRVACTRPLDSRPLARSGRWILDRPQLGALPGALLAALAVLRVVADRVLLELRAQRLACDAEQRRGPRLVALAHAQRVLDRHLLQLRERAHRAGRERIAGRRAAGARRAGAVRHLR